MVPSLEFKSFKKFYLFKLKMCNFDECNRPEGEPRSQSCWGVGDRNVSGAWAPCSNLLFPCLQWFSSAAVDTGGRGHTAQFEKAPIPLPPGDVHWSTIRLILLWVFLNLLQQNKQKWVLPTKLEWFYLFRGGQQQSCKEQNDFWISKPHELGWCKPTDWQEATQ